jgi:predicted MFS family arabinose efflux permease
MTSPSTSSSSLSKPPALSRWTSLLLAVAGGMIVANLYYAQPVLGPIAEELGLAPAAAGTIITLIQAGYGLGLLLIVPLGDLIENRRLILSVLALDIAAVLALSLTGTPAPFLAAALLVGLCSTVAQIIVPYAVQLAPDEKAGQAAGNVMSGIMLGIMLARPFSGFITGLSSWHSVFLISAVAMSALAVVLALTIPPYRPKLKIRYTELLASLGKLFVATPMLRQRAAYQFFLFGAFTLFWTASPLYLAQTFHLSHHGIALFALAGVAGAISAPVAGWAADKGSIRLPTGFAIAAAAASFLMSRIGTPGSGFALGMLVAAAILLDFATTASVVLGQRALFSLGAASRGRLNGLFIAIFFMGGALGSAIGGYTFAKAGWPLTSWAGFALPVLAFMVFMRELRDR